MPGARSKTMARNTSYGKHPAKQRQMNKAKRGSLSAFRCRDVGFRPAARLVRVGIKATGRADADRHYEQPKRGTLCKPADREMSSRMMRIGRRTRRRSHVPSIPVKLQLPLTARRRIAPENAVLTRRISSESAN